MRPRSDCAVLSAFISPQTASVWLTKLEVDKHKRLYLFFLIPTHIFVCRLVPPIVKYVLCIFPQSVLVLTSVLLYFTF